MIDLKTGLPVSNERSGREHGIFLNLVIVDRAASSPETLTVGYVGRSLCPIVDSDLAWILPIMVRQLLSDFPGKNRKATNFILPQTPQTISTEKNGYREAAEQGDAKAQNSLGHMYLSGDGTPKDSAKAAKWFRKAADQGDAKAQLRFGIMLKNGDGMPKDSAEKQRSGSL